MSIPILIDRTVHPHCQSAQSSEALIDQEGDPEMSIEIQGSSTPLFCESIFRV